MISSAVININTAAQNEIVAALAGASIEVIQYTLVCVPDNTVTFYSGNATAITGPMSFSTNESSISVSAPSSYQTVNGLFVTAVGEGLYILLSAGTQVSGHLTYRVNYA
jgi:hypothetical protein